MTITPRLFEAYLVCRLMRGIKKTNESPTGNAYAEWVETQTESYLAEGTNRLRSAALVHGCTVVSEIKHLKGARRLLTVQVSAQTRKISSTEVLNRSKGTPRRSLVPTSV